MATKIVTLTFTEFCELSHTTDAGVNRRLFIMLSTSETVLTRDFATQLFAELSDMSDASFLRGIYAQQSTLQ
jgi:hypothetical protein